MLEFIRQCFEEAAQMLDGQMPAPPVPKESEEESK